MYCHLKVISDQEQSEKENRGRERSKGGKRGNRGAAMEINERSEKINRETKDQTWTAAIVSHLRHTSQEHGVSVTPKRVWVSSTCWLVFEIDSERRGCEEEERVGGKY